jgi:hypothetical protein
VKFNKTGNASQSLEGTQSQRRGIFNRNEAKGKENRKKSRKQHRLLKPPRRHTLLGITRGRDAGGDDGSLPAVGRGKTQTREANGGSAFRQRGPDLG